MLVLPVSEVKADSIYTIGTVFTDAVHNNAPKIYLPMAGSDPSPAKYGVEWVYNSSFSGTITKIEVMMSDAKDPDYSYWESTQLPDVLNYLHLYVNGQDVGLADGYTYYSSGTEYTYGYTFDDPIIVYWNCNVEIESSNILFELEGNYDHNGYTGVIVSYSDIDGDGDKQVSLTYGSNAYADGVYTLKNDWNDNYFANACWYWNSAESEWNNGGTINNTVDVYYKITYSSSAGSSSGSYNETILALPDSVKQYETSEIIYLFNDTTAINYLTIEHDGETVYSDAISVLDGNLFFTPDDTGTYYINGTRSGNQVAAETLTVTSQSKDYFVYVPVSPVTTGTPFSVYVKYSGTDYDGLFTIEDEDGTIISSSAIGKNDSSVHVLTKTVNGEGKYYLKLYVNNPYIRTLVSEYVLYVKSQEYVSGVDADKSTVNLNDDIHIQIIHNAIGSNVYYYIHSNTGGYVVSKTYLTDNYVTSIDFTPTTYVGDYQIQLYLYGYLLSQYNFTVVSSSGEETEEEYHLMTPFEALGNTFGVGADGGKAIAGMMIVVASIGIVYSVNRKNFVQLPPVVYSIVVLLVSLICTLLGFFPLWIWVIFAIVLFIYIYNKFLSSGGFHIGGE